MNHNPDTYYNRSEVSNSDLTALKEVMHPRPMFGDREAAFRFGTLVDALITEPDRVDYYHLTVDDVEYTDDDFRHAKEMQRSLRLEAQKDPFLAKVLELRVSFLSRYSLQMGLVAGSVSLRWRLKDNLCLISTGI